MILSIVTTSIIKTGELFLSGCALGVTAFKSVKEATKKAK